MTCPSSSSLGLLLLLIAGAAAGKTYIKNTHLLGSLVCVVLTHVRVGVFPLTVWQEVVLDASTFANTGSLWCFGEWSFTGPRIIRKSEEAELSDSVEEDGGGAVVHRTLMSWSCI